jgi:hypothetical protein
MTAPTAYTCDACRASGAKCKGEVWCVCAECGYESCTCDGFTPMVREAEGHMPDEEDICDDCRPRAHEHGWCTTEAEALELSQEWLRAHNVEREGDPLDDDGEV